MLPKSEWADSGAGTLGALEVGATAALWTVTRPSALVDTSAGSIVGGLIALGHGPSNLYDIVISADYAKLIPMNEWLFPARGYLASNRNVIAWLREITNDQTMADCQIPFTAICSDLYTGKARTWDSWLLPDMPVWEAIHAHIVHELVRIAYRIESLPVECLRVDAPHASAAVRDKLRPVPLGSQ